MAKIAYSTELPRVGRKLRAPRHAFSLITRPWQIQPFLIAPVIPGETMKNLMIQSRCVTDPLVSKLTGWWNEYYFFYVKHRDLEGREDFTAMMLDLEKDMSAYKESASVPYYNFPNGFNWTKLCLQRVVETYFRNEGEAWDAFMIDGMPAGAVNIQSFVDSMLLGDAYDTPDLDVDANADDTITASEIDNAMRTWQFMRANQMTEMSYEDWLSTYGVRTPRVELHRPELLRYIREWQYPSNTVEPTDGTVASALSWSIRDRADKDRFFAEPGFIFGVTVARPKVYYSTQEGSAAHLMENALTWLPALMRDDPYTSLVRLSDTQGPFAATVTDSDGYWIDIKDLLLYGDQFRNFDPAGAVAGADQIWTGAALPDATLANKDYPSLTDSRNLFKATFATEPNDNLTRVRQDGIVTLSILGAQVDTTPPTSMGS